MLSELEAALKCMHSSVINDRLLSTFELSISGIVDALLAYLKFIQRDTDCGMAVIFRRVNILTYFYFFNALFQKFSIFVPLPINLCHLRCFQTETFFRFS